MEYAIWNGTDYAGLNNSQVDATSFALILFLLQIDQLALLLERVRNDGLRLVTLDTIQDYFGSPKLPIPTTGAQTTGFVTTGLPTTGFPTTGQETTTGERATTGLNASSSTTGIEVSTTQALSSGLPSAEHNASATATTADSIVTTGGLTVPVTSDSQMRTQSQWFFIVSALLAAFYQ